MNDRIVKKTEYKGNLCKLEIFDNTKYTYRSLPVHQKALELGLRIPAIYHIEKKGNLYHKYSEWVSGRTIREEMRRDKKMIEPIYEDLARYMLEFFNAGKIIPEDCHTENFVWHNNQVVYIDMKRLLFGDDDWFLEHMSKICLKSCRGNRKMTLAFLRGYHKHGDVKPVLKDCDRRSWKWAPNRGEPFITKPITMKELE